MKSILLINPIYTMEAKRIADEEHMDAKCDCTPLGLTTLAAITPDGYRVDLWDEFIRGKIEDSNCYENYDLVGVTGASVSLLRAIQIGAFFREQKISVPVVIGGPGVSATPDRFRGYFDSLFIGEAELTWPQFLRDWETGSYQSEYRQIEKPDMSLSPKPDWSSIAKDMDHYALGSVQTTRGCPFDCEFCDVVYLFGRQMRHKPVSQVIEEVQALEKLGASAIYFTDDNFVIDRRYAMELLNALIPVNNSFEDPLRYNTQGSIDVTRDEEQLEALADANFFELCVGVESPDVGSLKEVGKTMNLKGDLVEDLRKIQSYGIAIRGSLILGLDHDTPDIFDRRSELIQNAYFPAVNPNLLIAAIGTRLWRRFRQENRVLDIFKITDKVTKRFITNIIPKGMTRVQLLEGYRDLYKRIYSWKCFTERMIGFVSLSNRPPRVNEKPATLESLAGLGAKFGLEKEGSDAMNEIFTYTHERAPYLLRRVKDLVLQFTIHHKSANDLIPKLDEQIELESSGKLTFQFDTRPVTVSQGFTKAYPSLFRNAHKRVYRRINDKDAVPRVLVEVFVEFLVYEQGISVVEDHHVASLNEIIDRTCDRENGEDPEHVTIGEPEEIPVPNVGRIRLHEDVLKTVEQELLKLAQADAEAEPSAFELAGNQAC